MNTLSHSLQHLNTFGITAHCRQLTTLTTAEQTQQLWRTQGPPELLLGGGSNVLLVRQNFDCVWLNRINGRQVIQRSRDHVRVRLGAGENWDDAVAWSLEQQAYGLENLSLIPGCCGAAPIQNIGAYGVEIGPYIHRVQVLDLRDGAIRHLSAQACAFGYRHSVFKTAAGAHWLILAIELDLLPQPRLTLTYPGLQECLTAWQVNPITATDVRRAVIHIRRGKLPDPGELGNAGSFFKNPLVDAATAAALLREHGDLPHWPVSADTTKLSAAWLIDRCGFKGWRQGDTGVHAHHALVLVNHGRASGADLLQLAQQIQTTVAQRFGIELIPEPRIIT